MKSCIFDDRNSWHPGGLSPLRRFGRWIYCVKNRRVWKKVLTTRFWKKQLHTIIDENLWTSCQTSNLFLPGSIGAASTKGGAVWWSTDQRSRRSVHCWNLLVSCEYALYVLRGRTALLTGKYHFKWLYSERLNYSLKEKLAAVSSSKTMN